MLMGKYLPKVRPKLIFLAEIKLNYMRKFKIKRSKHNESRLEK